MHFSVLSIISLVAATASALNPIIVKGNAFFDSKTNERFYIRGIDYLPGGASDFTDPLADPDVCKRDIEYFKELGLNTIRVYSINNAANHDECMKALDDAGIYLILDVNTPENSINRGNPAPSYNTAYLQHVFATVDVFSKYDNTLGFFAANEVINDENTTNTAPYVKAVIRDMKTYIKERIDREIPVGYSAADISSNRYQQIQYFNCGDDEMARLDMFGMNDYSWCGDSSFTKSGYDQKVEQYSNYTRPLFLSEFGCNEVTPRKFTEIGAIYSDDMSSVFSGGLVYEYSQEANNYGVVEIKDGKVSKLPDFDNLKKAFKSVENFSGDGGYKTASGPAACPTYESGVWEVDPDETLPPMPQRASSMLKEGAGEPLGTDGPITQWGDAEDARLNGDYVPPEASGASASRSRASGATGSATDTASGATSSSAAANVVVPKIGSNVVVPFVALSASLLFGMGAVFAL